MRKKTENKLIYLTYVGTKKMVIEGSDESCGANKLKETEEIHKTLRSRTYKSSM